jgi:hypothetical protein
LKPGQFVTLKINLNVSNRSTGDDLLGILDYSAAA